MSIILKFILKKIKEKKLRTFLIVISIVASTALFFAASGIASTIKQSEINGYKSYYGSAEISISAGQNSPSPYLTTNKAEVYSNKLDYIIGEMNSAGSYEHTKDDVVSLSLIGVDYQDITIMNPLNISESLGIKPFEGNKIIISEKTAQKYNLNVGSKIKIIIHGSSEFFTVVGVSKAQGLFQMESQGVTGVIPKVAAQNLSNAKGKSSMIYIKTKDSQDKDKIIKSLSKDYKNYSVNETINMKEIDEETSSISTAFLVMLIIVLGMSIFIIYTVFKVIIVERLPVIGTFRSIGATKLTTNFVLIFESIIYGIIGGIFGTLGGIGIVKIASMAVAAQGVPVAISYSVNLMVEAFAFAVIISDLSALVPIITASRLSVKDVVLNTVDTVEKKKFWKVILACIFVAFGLIGPMVTLKQDILIVGLVGMVLSLIGVVVLVPYITDVFVIILQWVYALIFKNEGILAAKNLRNNKNIINNISLLAIGISTLFMLNVLSASLGKELVKAYAVYKCDVWVSGDIQKGALDKIRSTNGVSNADGNYTATNINVNIGATKNSLYEIWGYNPNSFNDFINMNFLQDKNSILKNLYDNREIVITESIRKAMDVNVGDVITLQTPTGNKNYKISGTFSTLMDNGKMALISEKYIKQDFKVNDFSNILIGTSGNSDKVVKTIKNEFKGEQIQARTYASIEATNASQNNTMLMLIKMFPIIALIIGAFGVLNNFVISFMERKRQLAVMASVGMSKKQTRKMLFVEALSVGIIGATIGIIGGLLLTNIVPYLLAAADFPMEMFYEPTTFIVCFILGILITMVSSLVPSIKSSKLNIIEAIKYE
ncbi:ABC transporter permease [Clostridium akagii]|uniref:ABC transporter permease n=1 Tax=Clostridium akagii TaxID=91623 RepID=UPI000479094E|nr:FtsX-like permease family protein [Clostridium akagii]